MQKKLFIDLENTLISPVVDSWLSSEVINIEKIKDFISQHEIESVNIFSFAIWNEQERNLFKNHLLFDIEEGLGQKILHIPTVDNEIIPACCKQKKMNRENVNFINLTQFWSKDLAFILCMKEWFKNSQDLNCILLDDMVENQNMNILKNNLNLSIFNIDEI